eukprot:5029866-Amphidinium_carterae.2
MFGVNPVSDLNPTLTALSLHPRLSSGAPNGLGVPSGIWTTVSHSFNVLRFKYASRDGLSGSALMFT